MELSRAIQKFTTITPAKPSAARIEIFCDRNFSSPPGSQAGAFRQTKTRVWRKDARQNASSVRERYVRSTCKRPPGVEIHVANPTPAQISATVRDIAAGALRRHHR